MACVPSPGWDVTIKPPARVAPMICARIRNQIFTPRPLSETRFISKPGITGLPSGYGLRPILSTRTAIAKLTGDGAHGAHLHFWRRGQSHHDKAQGNRFNRPPERVFRARDDAVVTDLDRGPDEGMLARTIWNDGIACQMFAASNEAAVGEKLDQADVTRGIYGRANQFDLGQRREARSALRRNPSQGGRRSGRVFPLAVCAAAWLNTNCRYGPTRASP